MPAAASDGPSTPVQGYSTAYKIYILILLLAIYVTNYADRILISVVTPALKEEFGLSSATLGLLSGVTFAVFYATLGVPIALYADRSNRTAIISASAAVWSVFTAACGFAQSFWQLAGFRVGVGVGEAGSSPPSHSIISDLFTPKARTTALAVYSLGVPFGIFVAIYGGSWIVEQKVVQLGPLELPGWRAAFVILGVPGLLLGLLAILTIREPQRGLSEGLKDQGEAPPLMVVASHMLTHKSLIHAFIGATLTTLVGYAGVQWWPTFMIQSHGLTLTDMSLFLALVFGGASGLGIFASGIVTDRLARLDPKWMPQAVALTILVTVPFAVALYLANDVALVYALIFVPAFAGGFYLAPTYSMTQSLVGVRMRTVASALLLFVINIVGYSLGPLFAGLLDDYWKPTLGKDAMRYALLTLTVFNVWAIYHYWRAGKFYAADLARQKALNQAESAKA